MKIVVIGAVAAGLKAASKARRSDPKAEITVIEKGEIISYGACGMPYYVAGEIADIDALIKTAAGALRNSAYFKNVNDIVVLTHTLATGINRQEKTVSVKNLVNGEESDIPYDKLVIATGALPLKPQLVGINLENIFQFWHPDDAKTIRQGIERKSFANAVIIGAGLVGMEMAEALTNWGITVTVVELQQQVLPALLDGEISGIVEKYLSEKGIQLLLGEKVVSFEGSTVVTAVKTEKRVIPADLVILAMGVRPNVELAKRSGLSIGSTGAIAVDSCLRTSDPDIFAGGDCVENTHIISGESFCTHGIHSQQARANYWREPVRRRSRI